MKIRGLENISALFSVFHDGRICAYTFENNELNLEIGILYLAQRVDPTFTKFNLKIEGLTGLKFVSWPSPQKLDSDIISDATVIFSNTVEILGGKVIDDQIKVECCLHPSQPDYWGGDIFFRASVATVKDENNKAYSIEELKRLSKDYWEDWARASK